MFPQLEQRIGKRLTSMAKWLAYCGGLSLTLIAVLTVISIVGRAFVGFGLSPVKGDFELVEIGAAVAIFSFLPWCQLNRGHVNVDILVRHFPARLQKFFEVLGDIAIAIIAIIIMWRLWMGMGERVTWFSQETRDLLGFGYKPFSIETTFILGMPTWYGYALGFIGALMFAVVSVYTVWRDSNEWLAMGNSNGRA